jgi:hypothetical protein
VLGYEWVAVQKILDHLGLSTPQAEKPPPLPPEVVRVAEHAGGLVRRRKERFV